MARDPAELVPYLNSLLHDLQKILWEHCGAGARFRVPHVGWEFFSAGGTGLGEGCSPEEALLFARETLEGRGIVASVESTVAEAAMLPDTDYYRSVEILEVRVRGCLHLPVDHQLMAEGIAPYVCPVANLLAQTVARTRAVIPELASAEVEGETCRIRVVLFDPSVGEKGERVY